MKGTRCSCSNTTSLPSTITDGYSFTPSTNYFRFIYGESNGITAGTIDISSSTTWPDSAILNMIESDVGGLTSTLGFKTSSGNTGQLFFDKANGFNSEWFSATAGVESDWITGTSTLRNYFYFPDSSMILISESFSSSSHNYTLYNLTDGKLYKAYSGRFDFQNAGFSGRIGVSLITLYNNEFWHISIGENNYYSKIKYSSGESNVLALALAETQRYPITYHYTNSTVSGPSEAAVGDTVTVSAVPNAGYGITDASTQILVTNNDVAVPYTWDATNNRITFTMPDPS